MRKLVVAVGVIALLAGLPSPGTIAGPAATADDLRALALERSGGDLDRLGVMVTYGPDGAVERAITGHEFLALAEQALRHLDSGTDAATPDGGIGFGTPHRRLPQRLGWPFCDYASMFVLYYGGAAQAIQRAEPAPLELPVGPSEPLCGAVYGVASTWLDVTFDGSGTANVFGPCIAAMVVAPLADADAGLAGGYICNSPVTSAHGRGILVSLWFFGIALDYFLGETAVVMTGSASA